MNPILEFLAGCVVGGIVGPLVGYILAKVIP
jgi:gas vesicle protein